MKVRRVVVDTEHRAATAVPTSVIVADEHGDAKFAPETVSTVVLAESKVEGTTDDIEGIYDKTPVRVTALLGEKHLKVSTRSRKTPVPLGMSMVIEELLTTTMEEACRGPIAAVISDAEQVKPEPVTVILNPGALTAGATFDIACCPAKQCSKERKDSSTNRLTGNFKIISLRTTKELVR